MKLATLLYLLSSSLLPLLAKGAPAPLSTAADAPGKITVTASRSGEPKVHQLPMQAAGRAFWLGGHPATYCPTFVENCPPGNETVIAGLSAMVCIPITLPLHSYDKKKKKTPHLTPTPPSQSTLWFPAVNKCTSSPAAP